MSPSHTAVHIGQYDTKYVEFNYAAFVREIISVDSYQPKHKTRERIDLPLRPSLGQMYQAEKITETTDVCTENMCNLRSYLYLLGFIVGSSLFLHTTAAQIRAQYGRRIISASSLILG